MRSWGSPIRQAATPRRWRIPIEYFDTRSSARRRRPTRSRADPLEGRPDTVARRGFACGGEDLEVLSPGQMAVEPGLVDDGPDPRQGLIAMPWNQESEQGHRARVGVGESQEHPDERGLAGAVRTQVAERASAGDKKLDTVYGDVVSEALGEPVSLDRPAIARDPALDHGRSIW